jgi:hypothetical protein
MEWLLVACPYSAMISILNVTCCCFLMLLQVICGEENGSADYINLKQERMSPTDYTDYTDKRARAFLLLLCIFLKVTELRDLIAS